MFRQTIQKGILLLCLIFSTNAFAESVVLLSTDGEGEDKLLVDKILAEELELHPDYELQKPREIGISDLILGVGCDVPDEKCMGQLSSLIQADRLVFAKVGETLSIRIYDFKEQRFIGDGSKMEVGDEGKIRAQIKAILFANSGEIFVDVGPGNAEIFIDGKSYGISPQTLQNLSLGKHTILVRTSDGSEQTRNVVLEAGKVERVSFTMEPLDSGETPKIVKMLPGLGVMVLGIAGIGFGVSQSLTVKGFSDELAEEERTNSIFSDNQVTEIEAQQLRDGKWGEIHNRADNSSAETLQWVGYGVGLVGLGLGSYLLYSALGESAEVSISPNPLQPSASLRIKF